MNSKGLKRLQILTFRGIGDNLLWVPHRSSRSHNVCLLKRSVQRVAEQSSSLYKRITIQNCSLGKFKDVEKQT